ncbi:hypothetical protein [Actinokineospora globicatena]|uniref:Peptidase inhibitor family I36 n=1 Tax=Actinokineospora globicatena TaxID=103729 RepID=A0A9W6V7S1_9PSEU|nr:hypothetical protein [Actinokineospora globicatena]GLW91637.1 hypothetical protein Aglo03_24530 [Actinokineospora globicatena]
MSIRSILAAAGCAIVLAMFGAPTAGAQPLNRFWECDAGTYCIMTDIDYEHYLCEWSSTDLNYTNDYCYYGIAASPADDSASSYRNNGAPHTYDDIYSFRRPNNTADKLWFAPRGESRSWVSPCLAEPCNDQASGHQWV